MPWPELTPSVPAASASTTAAKRQRLPVRNGRIAGSTGRISIAAPAPRSASGASTFARPTLQPSATASACPRRPPSSLPYSTTPMNMPTAISASASTSRWRSSSWGSRGGHHGGGQPEPRRRRRLRALPAEPGMRERLPAFADRRLVESRAVGARRVLRVRVPAIHPATSTPVPQTLPRGGRRSSAVEAPRPKALPSL